MINSKPKGLNFVTVGYVDNFKCCLFLRQTLYFPHSSMALTNFGDDMC